MACWALRFWRHWVCGLCSQWTVRAEWITGNKRLCFMKLLQTLLNLQRFFNPAEGVSCSLNPVHLNSCWSEHLQPTSPTVSLQSYQHHMSEQGAETQSLTVELKAAGEKKSAERNHLVWVKVELRNRCGDLAPRKQRKKSLLSVLETRGVWCTAVAWLAPRIHQRFEWASTQSADCKSNTKEQSLSAHISSSHILSGTVCSTGRQKTSFISCPTSPAGEDTVDCRSEAPHVDLQSGQRALRHGTRVWSHVKEPSLKSTIVIAFYFAKNKSLISYSLITHYNQSILTQQQQKHTVRKRTAFWDM